eukprot:Em0001g3291a
MLRNKFLKKCVAVQCVHGDEDSYPLAKVEVVVDGKSYLVEAAVVKKLPKSVLLGRDVPELVRIGNPEEALAAMTRAQAKRKREEEESELEKEKDSGVKCRSLTPVPETVKEKLLPGPVGPEDDGLERMEIIVNDGDLGVDEKDLRELQLEDETLGAVRESAKQSSNAGNYWFYEEDGLLYRHWHPREEGEELGIEQLIIPKQHREAVLRLAHEIPLAGHLGKKYHLQDIWGRKRQLSESCNDSTGRHYGRDGLVERFNGTLKSMLRKTALEGKDWDKLLPYLLFAYREVPQATTGFSPFELMYGRHVRGPLDILKETWKASKRSGEMVISYVLTVQQKLAMMSELVSENCKEAQMTQKRWYDQSARKREFMEGDQVLVLLPTVTNKLMAKWQGPYCVKAKVTPVTYEIDMSDKKKRQRIFHVNMLKGWNTPTTVCLAAEEMEDGEEIPLWKEESEEPKINEKLTQKQKKELDALRTEFGDVMSDLPGKTEIVEHRIETGDAKPVRLPPYRLPHAYRDIVKKELEEMEKHGIIENSSSDWSSPIALVKKKDRTLRFCTDFRRLNSVSKTDAYPMPRVDDLLDELGQARFISTLDLTKGYWQVQPKRKRHSGLPFGLYQFRRMPFGLQGAPSTFQRMMDSLLVGMQDFAAAYLDDLVIFSRSWPEHMLLLQKLREADLTVKQKKCQLAMSRCSYLGHVVGEGLVRHEHSKVDSVKQFQVPTTKSDRVSISVFLTSPILDGVLIRLKSQAPATPMARPEASVCSTNGREKSGDLKIGSQHRQSFSRLKALSHSAVHCTWFGAFFLVKSVNGAAISAYSWSRREEVEGVSGKPASPKGPECNN